VESGCSNNICRAEASGRDEDPCVLRGLRGEKQPGPLIQSERSKGRNYVTGEMAGLRAVEMEYRVANMRWIFRPSTVFETSVAVARKCCVLLSADDDG